MTTLVKYLVATILSLVLFSCNFPLGLGGVKGNGNVTIENRKVNQSFNAIKTNQGLDVYVTQGNEENITIEADENLHELIRTEVKNNELNIFTDKNIGSASSKKVMITFKDISKITSTSGSDVISTATIQTDDLELNSSSGSDMKLDVITTSLICNASSGSDLKISGKTDKLTATATSGSDIKAIDLVAETSHASANSGADIVINTSQELIANANSGGNITYYGNPNIVNINNDPSGSINKH